MQDFAQSMPLLWRYNTVRPLERDRNQKANCNNQGELTYILPPAIGGRWPYLPSLSTAEKGAGLLAKQEQKLEIDWRVVARSFPDNTWEDYAYHWLVVNTRSFYFELPGATSTAYEDRMVMCPFVDYFNHNDHGVSLPRLVGEVERD